MAEESKKGGDVATTDIYNVEAAEILANEAQHLPILEAAPIYEKLLSTFPTAAKYWKQYVEAYMNVNNDEAAKQIFSRCLLNCLHISLWLCYIRFIKKANEKKGAEGLEETRKAFDFMLSYVGSDIASGPVWMEYITFLKSMPATTAQEESHRMTSVRKVYQKAIVTPTHHVEQLWKDYENFENSVSRALAKGLLSEYHPKFNSARAVYKERKKYMDEIDWNMLAVPPTGTCKEEQQCMAWKRLLAFEKGNPQRIDASSANRRVTFTFEQSLMYLYHYPDIWYDYATWHAKSGSVDSAVKFFQRALKALPDSELLKYAYAELEESRGAIQPAKKIYESLVANDASTMSLAHIQFIRFLRRTEGIEAARKYFLDAQKMPTCTYHVFVAYAMMAFCLDKDSKVAHSVFEAGLKRFMHEPRYILEYADFLCRLNDDRNVRALFERALSSLPPENSVEVWKRFSQFEKTYGDLTSMLKVEQRKKEALSRTAEDGSSELESTLYDVVSRYSFMDLWPCSSKDLDHLARQEWLAKNINKKVDKSSLPNGANIVEKGSFGLTNTSKVGPPSTKIVYPDTSQMIIYDPRQAQGLEIPAVFSSTTTSSVALVGSGNAKAVDEILKVVSPALVAFITHLPAVEGPSPDVDMVLSILLQSSTPIGQLGRPTTQQISAGGRHHPYRGSQDFPPGGRGGFRGGPDGFSHQMPMGGPRRGGGGGFSGRGGGSPDNADRSKFAKLFIGSVPRTATEEEIRPVFEEHGDVIEVALIKDKRTGQQQGCCFVKYATSEEADRAIKALHNQYTLPGGSGPIQVRYADGERERLGAVEHKLFVGSLNKQATEMEIEEIFSPYGHVEDIYIMRDDRKQSRGCGFVKFSNREMAAAAINALNGTFVMRGCNQPLIVRFADPKRPRPGESRGGPAFGGPGFGPQPQAPIGVRPVPTLSEPIGGPPRFAEPMSGVRPNAWHPASPESMEPSPQASSQGFGANLVANVGDLTTPSVSMPIQQLGKVQIPQTMGFPSISQALPSQQLLNLGAQLPASQALFQQTAAANGLQLPLNPQQPGLAAASSQQQMPASSISQQQLQQPVQQLPSQLSQALLQQQAQALQLSFQSSQQAISQLQQQLQMIQPPSASQQQNPQTAKQQSPWSAVVSQSASSNPVSTPAVTSSNVSTTPPPSATQSAVPISCDWSEHTSPDGYKYYYNCVTCESRWEKPEELTRFEEQKKSQQQMKLVAQHLQPPSQAQSQPPIQSTQVSQTQQTQLQGQHRQQAPVQFLQPLPYQASGLAGQHNNQDFNYAQFQAANSINDSARAQQAMQAGQEVILKNMATGS